MATINKFEDLEIWQSAREINKKIFPVLQNRESLRAYKLKEQMDGAAGSVMDNIAEGFERDGNREFIQFLAVSKGSLGEVRSQLYRALDRVYLEKDEHELLQQECRDLGTRIAKFVSYLNRSEYRGNKFKTSKPETINKKQEISNGRADTTKN